MGIEPVPDPLEALQHLEAWITKCGRCSDDVQRSIDMIRVGLRAKLDEPEDPLEDAASAIRKADSGLRTYQGPHLTALLGALTEAAAQIRYARKLMEDSDEPK